MEFRLYSDDKQAEVLELVLEFAYEAEKVNTFKPTKERILQIMEVCRNTSLLLYVDKKLVGVIGGFESINFMSTEPIWHEVLFFIKSGYRIHSKDFFKVFEVFIRNKGFKIICFGCVHNDKHKLMDRFYRSLGFKPIEHHYMKRI